MLITPLVASRMCTALGMETAHMLIGEGYVPVSINGAVSLFTHAGHTQKDIQICMESCKALAEHMDVSGRALLDRLGMVLLHRASLRHLFCAAGFNAAARERFLPMCTMPLVCAA